ncbi:MAG TPA: CopG family ribbon-helix-helix protein [Alphaproteobacteria bacterium]|jgi:predicted transcriptional regulator
MRDSVPLSFRVRAEKAEQLDRLAEATDRPRSWLLQQALDSYLELQAWQMQEIEAGLRDLEEGRTIPHEKVKAWVESWGTDKELERPK